MARTIFVTKQYVTDKINTETSQRITGDAAIDKSINTQATKISDNAITLASVNAKITAETTTRQTQVGNMSFNSSLVNADSSAVSNLTEAVNATIRLKGEVDAQISGIDVSGYQAIQNKVAALETKVTSDTNKIEAILLNANVNYDSFAEIVSLINAKDAETAADLAVIKTDLEAILATKMPKVQTSASALEYIDANDNTKRYKIVIVDGQLAVENLN
jgi:hypothetical protein